MKSWVTVGLKISVIDFSCQVLCHSLAVRACKPSLGSSLRLIVHLCLYAPIVLIVPDWWGTHLTHVITYLCTVSSRSSLKLAYKRAYFTPPRIRVSYSLIGWRKCMLSHFRLVLGSFLFAPLWFIDNKLSKVPIKTVFTETRM